MFKFTWENEGIRADKETLKNGVPTTYQDIQIIKVRTVLLGQWNGIEIIKQNCYDLATI